MSLNDPEFYDHLKRISKVNPKVNSKDFVQEIISNESRKRSFVSNFSSADEDTFRSNKELLYDPIIFVRKWIGECFAGVLYQNALLYVWDQLFMSVWSSYDLEILTKALIYLLKNDFMQAFDFDDMRRVFLEHPCKLYTSDIQSAYMHLFSGRKESEVPFLNKSTQKTFSKNNGYYTKPNQRDQQTNAKKTNLNPIGLKDMHLTLTIPKTGSTADFDPTRLSVEVTLYSGKYKLSQDETTSIPQVTNVKASLNNTKMYEMSISNERIIFDISTYDKDRFGNNDILALIVVKYQTQNYSHFILGYSKIVLCSLQKIGKVFTWSVAQGNIKKFLHPGNAPSSLEKISENPSTSYKERLGPGSCITINVFDSTYEQF